MNRQVISSIFQLSELQIIMLFISVYYSLLHGIIVLQLIRAARGRQTANRGRHTANRILVKD